MSKSVLSDLHYHDEEAAYAFVEARVWPKGCVCPHCGTVARSGKLQGKSTRIGVYKCYECRKPFTVKVGTIFEASHIKLHIWLQAMFLLCSSEKGISSNQLHRTLGVTLKTAWFLSHRIREAMKDGGGPLGGEGQTVEVDETYRGPSDMVFVNGQGWQKKQGAVNNRDIVVTLVERKGRARSFRMEGFSIGQLSQIVTMNAHLASVLNTDQAKFYRNMGTEFAKHETVNHSEKEYPRGATTTNTVEGLLFVLRAGHAGHLPALQRAAFAAVSDRIRFPLQQSRCPWRERRKALRARLPGHRRAPVDLSNG